MKAPSEKHLEDWIAARNGCIIQAPQHFRHYEVIGRQVRLPSGIVDLIVFDGVQLWVMELKKHSIDTHALAQVLRYISNIKKIWSVVIEQVGSDAEVAHVVFPLCVHGILVGHSVSDDIFTAAGAADVTAYLYDYRDGEYNFRFAGEQLIGMTTSAAREYACTNLGQALRNAFNLYAADDGRFVVRSAE